jgi:hypothetical protein
MSADGPGPTKCVRCERKDEAIADLQHLLREARHVEENLVFAIGLLQQRARKVERWGVPGLRELVRRGPP